ncbi:MAG: Tungsten-containing aldehyde ferredoxin oxidoreductase [Promethearchaeota archaeon]|nr:MAG: Tungsten-containing aldehyde ferredoxin oxidoreductase [Candidatus Lokiarchaeota archaeon]
MKILAQLRYAQQEINKGYANQTLYVNLTTNELFIKPVTQKMKDLFIGGKGFNLFLMWNALPKDRIVKWGDPENEICIASGPLGASTYYPGAGKSIVTTISPLTGIIIDSNVGGYFGPYLKFSGFDALEIQGKAKNDVILFINGQDNLITLEQIEESDYIPEYSHLLTQALTQKYAKDSSRGQLQQVSVVSTGPAAKFSRWGMLNFSWYSRRRKWASYKQAGRGGCGTVFADKNLKALVCRAPRIDARKNNPADPELVKKIGRTHHKEIVELDPTHNQMREVGTGYLPDIMNVTDLLPTENFRFGHHPQIAGKEIPFKRQVWADLFAEDTGTGADGCWLGCSVSCSHYKRGYTVKTGPFKGKKVIVDGPEYETIAGCGSNWGVWDPEWVLEANFYCDTYGLDTISVGTGIAFVMECYEAGILDKGITGGLELHFGNAEAALDLIHQMREGKGFGRVVGQGIKFMKNEFTKYGGDPHFLQDIGMEHKGLEFSEYVTKESLTQQGGYGFTNKGPQHDEAWLIFEDVVRGSIPSFKDKAAALTWFPYFRTWFSLQGLCKLPWNDVVSEENYKLPIKDPDTGELVQSKIPYHVQWYAKYYSAVTGIESGPDDIIRDSERVYTFQRIFNIRQGKGLRKDDSHFPYRAMGPVTRLEYESRQERYDDQLKTLIDVNPEGKSTEEKMKILREYREKQYELLQNAVYRERRWTKNGCPSIELVKELGLDCEEILQIITPHQ